LSSVSGGGELAGPLKSRAQSRVHLRAAWAELGRLAQLADRMLKIALLHKRQRQIEMTIPCVGLQADRGTESRNRAGHLIAPGEPGAQRVIRIGGWLRGESALDLGRTRDKLKAFGQKPERSKLRGRSATQPAQLCA